MTTLIKSNNIAKNTIGHISGFAGPSDFTVFLDFNRQDYLTVDSDGVSKHTLEDCMVCERTGEAMTIDKDYNLTQVVGSAPRISYSHYANVYGLCAELGTTNFLSTPSNPTTQAVSMTGGAENVVCSLYGSGSISLEVGSDLEFIGGSGTQGDPIFYRRLTTGTINTTANITGNPTFAQVEIRGQARTPTPSSRGDEGVKLTDLIKSKVNPSEFTIVVSTQPMTDIRSRTGGALGINYSNGDFMGITLSENKDTSSTDRLKKTVSSVSSTIATLVGKGAYGNYSITHSEGQNYAGFTAIRNAKVGDGTDVPSGAISDIYPLSAPGADAIADRGPINGICVYMVIYNRAMTEQEIASCAASPINY